MCSAHDTGKSNQTQSECCRNANEDATVQSENTKKNNNSTMLLITLLYVQWTYFLKGIVKNPFKNKYEFISSEKKKEEKKKDVLQNVQAALFPYKESGWLILSRSKKSTRAP